MRKTGQTQNEVYEYIKAFIQEHSYPPTVREIGKALGLKSTSTVHMHITKLAQKGLIIVNPSKQRSIVLAEKQTAKAATAEKQTRRVPMVGSVAAGTPILAVENVQEYYTLPQRLLRGAGDNEIFMLRVQGESMIDAGIASGDAILVHNGIAVEQGDIVVARVSGESATVKRLYFENEHKIRLQPENPSMQPIIVDAGDVEIIGKLIGLYRQY